jgi:hypothetical protein
VDRRDGQKGCKAGRQTLPADDQAAVLLLEPGERALRLKPRNPFFGKRSQGLSLCIAQSATSILRRLYERMGLCRPAYLLAFLLERVMHSGAWTYGPHRVMVIPAQAGIQEVPGIWIPAYAGMTLHLDIHRTSKQIAKRSTCITRSRGCYAL